MIFPPRTSRAPGGRSWDIEVDLTRLIKLLPQVVSKNCLGIWISVDSGSWSSTSVCQLLRDALPGRSVQALQLEIATRDGRVLPAGGAACWFDDSDYLHGSDAARAMTAEQLEEHLDAYLDAVLSSRRTATGLAKKLASFELSHQVSILHWVEVISHTNAEMAYQVAAYGSEAMQQLDEAGMEAWIIHAMDVYDQTGLHAGISALKEVESYARQIKERRTGIPLEEVQGVLENFIQGLNGRGLKLEQGGQTYTDTEVLFLPGMANQLTDRERNFQLYKAIAVHQWAQCWYGTWRMSLHKAVSHFAGPEKATRIFHALETVRLEACIQRDLPGIYREMKGLRLELGTPVLPETWHEAVKQLQDKSATVQDSYDWLPKLYDGPVPEPAPYQGELYPKKVEQVRAARLIRDQGMFRLGLVRILDEIDSDISDEQKDQEQLEPANDEDRFRLNKIPDSEHPDGFTFELTLDGNPVAPPDNIQSVMESIVQDLGEIPDEYLLAAGDGAYRNAPAGEDGDADDVWKGTYHEKGAFIYNEWDFERQHYRKNWAVLRELTVHPQYDEFVQETLQKYGGLVKSLRRVFEALRGEDRVLKKQPYGDDVDIDALVETYADSSIGLEMSERVFTKKYKLERDIAVMFMVDMSGSTKGWINDAEREALVLLAESLETLGDRYAIYGFSGMTRKRCEVYRVKDFHEPYTDEVRARISGITPQDYTRMGVTIRHLSALLNQVEARTKLLITLSDGKPDDYDTYRGTYGIEDTRQALIEAKRDGIHSFCITIDKEANDYLPHNYTVIDEVRKLPLKVSDIYRRLTT
jgi:nitric oxide reductase NorD protein